MTEFEQFYQLIISILFYIYYFKAIPDSIELSTFLTPVNSIERSAGFHIFNKLPKSSLRYVNGKKAGSVW